MLSKLILQTEVASQIQTVESILSELNLTRGHPDLIWIEPKDPESSLGVKEAKFVREHFHFKPYSAKGRVAVIIQADRLSLDAQNSLLKTLEEAPDEALLILTAQSEQSLLPTVVSRCQIISSATSNPQPNTTRLGEWQNTLDQLIASSLPERFQIIEKTEEKDELFEALVLYIQTKLRSDPSWLEFSKLLIRTKEYKEANGNIRGILEYLMLNL